MIESTQKANEMLRFWGLLLVVSVAEDQELSDMKNKALQCNP